VKIDRKKILLAVGWLFLLVLIFVFIQKISHIVEILSQLKWYWLLAAVFAQLGTYAAVAMLVKIFLANFAGGGVRFLRLYKLAFSSSYINQIVPSWGAASIFFWTYSLRRHAIPIDKGITVGVANHLLNLLMVFILINVGLGYLVFKRVLTELQALAAVLMLLIIIIVFVALIWVLTSRRRLERLVAFALRPIDAVLKFFEAKKKGNGFEEEIRKFLTTEYLTRQLPLTFKDLFSKKIALLLMFLSASVFYAFDVLTIYFLFLGFGYAIHGGVLLTGFAFTLIFAYISLIPADVGVFEASMTFVYTGLGVPFGVALLTTFAFRALAYWLTIPFGYLVFRELTNNRKA
jgi:uncharacterized protein (TIRG00374 family)